MLVSDLDYDLPDDLIAQHPLEKRDASRMMVLDRSAQNYRDSRFEEFASQLSNKDVVVINNTQVFPARLLGKRDPSGAVIELFLIRERENGTWETLARPARRIPIGSHINFGDGKLRAEVLEASSDGRRIVRFACDGDFDAILDEIGQTPLPPYIKRGEKPSPEDEKRYQTIYARHSGAIAAPTAGLHFTPTVLANLRARGTEIVEVTLHVGYGTFQPIRVNDLANHTVASERYEISVEAALQLNDARQEQRRIVAIGTTTTRALESSVDETGKIIAGSRDADLTIIPGYKFRVVDALLTNFHLPQSSLLALVAAFASRDFVLSAYEYAIKLRYRFYSYGDCMLII
jgi:S-adenosylmethionine:tRNA ribosyltransferase-isomerase